MKKTLAILLIGIFSFNLGGFYPLFGIQLVQAGDEISQSFCFRDNSGSFPSIFLQEHRLSSTGLGSRGFKGSFFIVAQGEDTCDGEQADFHYEDGEEAALLKAFARLTRSGRQKHKKKNSGFKVLKFYPRPASKQPYSGFVSRHYSRAGVYVATVSYSAPFPTPEGPPPRLV